MKIITLTSAALAVALTGCASNFDEYRIRESVADKTCEAQYTKGRQNYLAAVETIIETIGVPNAANAPLDAFRAEINAAYNTVVQRCKTHTHCLESRGYREAKCYMAASDRKDAERSFADLAKELRRIERQMSVLTAAAGSSTSVNVTTRVEQTNKQKQKQKQKQKTDAQTGDRIEDQDVLAICGDARNLLKAKCRKPCANC